MTRRTPHLLFVPGGGQAGSGESMRTLVLADAARRRWPEARIGILTDDRHPRLEHDTFERHVIPGKVSRNVDAVSEVLRSTTPHVVVFDSRGSAPAIACASRLGSRTVYIAAQARILRRVFRSRRLRHLDQLWLVHQRLGPVKTPLGWRRRLRLALGRRPSVHVFDSIFPDPVPARGRELREKLGLGDAPYVLFAAGGGGYRRRGRPVSEVFAEAAQRVHAASGVRCVAVMGPLYDLPAPRLSGVTVVDWLAPDLMMDALSGAHLVACGGGGLVCQALAQQRVCVAAPAGGTDQPERIRLCAGQGLIESAPLDPDAIATRVGALLEDEPRRQQIRDRVAGCGFRNGLSDALHQLERLVAAE